MKLLYGNDSVAGENTVTKTNTREANEGEWFLHLIYLLKTSIDFNSGAPPALPTPATV